LTGITFIKVNFLSLILKMVKNFVEEKIEIPDNVDLTIDNDLVKVKGPKGENQRKFKIPLVKLQKTDNFLVLKTSRNTKKEKRMLYTTRSHIKNLIDGAINEYVYTLKILSSHFPMTVSISNNELIIKNFLGEKIPRRAQILTGINVDIAGDIVTVSGTNLESAGQTASNIEQACRITNKDRRVFMDGIWLTSKAKDKAKK